MGNPIYAETLNTGTRINFEVIQEYSDKVNSSGVKHKTRTTASFEVVQKTDTVKVVFIKGYFGAKVSCTTIVVSKNPFSLKWYETFGSGYSTKQWTIDYTSFETMVLSDVESMAVNYNGETYYYRMVSTVGSGTQANIIESTHTIYDSEDIVGEIVDLNTDSGKGKLFDYLYANNFQIGETESTKNPIYARCLQAGDTYEETITRAYDVYTQKTDYSGEILSGSDVYMIPCVYNIDNNYYGITFLLVSISDFKCKIDGLEKTAISYNYNGVKCYYEGHGATSYSKEWAISDSTIPLVYYEDICEGSYNFDTLICTLVNNNFKIGETENWLCNGTEVAPFPETHLFKVLAEVSGNIVLMASDKPAEYILSGSGGDTLVFDGSANGTMYVYDVANVEWVLQGSSTVSTYPVGGTITWSNYLLNRKATADSTEVEEISRETMIDGTTYDGAEYFETPDTGGSGGDNEGGNTGGDTGGGEVTVTFDTQAFLNGLICGLLGKGV